MVIKAEGQRTAQNPVCQDLNPMAKAKLLELQSSVEANQLDGKSGCNPSPQEWIMSSEIHQESGMFRSPDLTHQQRILSHRERTKETNREPKGKKKRTMTYPRIA